MSDIDIKPVPATLPAITPASRGFWEYAQRGMLVLPHCRACGHAWYPPSSACPQCLSDEGEFRAVSGRAKLWSWTVIHRQYMQDFPPPYLVAFVELEEGPMLMSTLANFSPQELRCELPVRAVFEKLTDDVHILKFEPARN